MKQLWWFACLLFTGCLALNGWFPLLGRASQLPPADIRTFAPTLRHALLYAFLVCALFVLYWLSYRAVRQSGQTPALWLLLLATLLFGLPLVLTYPVNAVDVFRYFYEGRMIVEHGANPLTTPPEALADDPMQPFAAILLHKTSPYGPLWELLSALIYRLSRGSVLGALILFKGLGLLAHIAAGIVIWQLLAAQEARTRLAQTLLWLWNPALLFMFVMDAHNDILMLLCLLLGYWCIRRGYPAWGLVLLALAPLVKPVGLLVVPFFAVAAWQQTTGWRQRIRLVAIALVGGSVLTLLAFLPFGSPLPLIQRLADEAQTGPSFSPVHFVIVAGEQLGYTPAIPSVARIASLLFGGGALVLLWLAWRGRSVLRGVADIFALYFLTALKFRIWYPTWLFPWLVLDVSGRFRLYTGIWFLLLSQLSVIHYGHIRVAWLDQQIPLALLIGVPLVFVGPFLLGWLGGSLQKLSGKVGRAAPFRFLSESRSRSPSLDR